MALTKIQLSELLAVYGNLLTDKQRDVLSMYCDCDCTLTEIGAEKNITRQGVRDTVLKAESAFEKLEECLRLAEFVRAIKIAIGDNDDEKIVEIAKKFAEKE